MLEPRRWYAWQTVSAKGASAPWCTPAFVTEVQPLKTGKGILRIDFIAVLHRVAAKRLRADLRIALHRPSHLVGTYVDEKGEEQTGVFQAVDFRWLEQYCTSFWRRFPKSRFEPYGDLDSIDTYLNLAFGHTEERILSGATPSAFGARLHSMPKERATIPLNRTYSTLDSYLIRRGFVPTAQEDKWFIYFKDEWLFMHRSWTGFCVYAISFEERDDRLYASHGYSNRVKEEYSETDDEHDRKMILYLIDAVLLGRGALFPTKEDATPGQQPLIQWHKVGNAMLYQGERDERDLAEAEGGTEG
jgi:hypothetical protein